MKSTILVLVFFVLLGALLVSSRTQLSEEQKKILLKAYKGLTYEEIDEFVNNLEKEINDRVINDPEQESLYNVTTEPFNCPFIQRSPTRPTSVHKLLPGDIDVVCAMGDSLTAAFGAQAKSLFTLFNEWRGISWSIGGDFGDVDKVVTLTNIIKKFNPNVKGFSIGKCKEDSVDSHLDVAITGAVATDLMKEAYMLIDRLNNTPGINYNDDWKMLTIFIGHNDLCVACEDEKNHGAAAYLANIEKVLDFLKANVPRLFINLVPPLDVTKLHDVNRGLCGLLHYYECKCAATSDKSLREKTKIISQQYEEGLFKLRDLPKFNDDDDFTVVIQPWTKDILVPTTKDGKPDVSFFAPDCFHFSAKSHGCAAIALWDNIMEPIKTKRTMWFPGEKIECPEDREYLYTNKNSYIRPE